jgi:hypothetical protein
MKAAQNENRTARGVEQRHVVHERVAGLEAGAHHRVDAVADKAVVVEQGAFRKAGGAGGVLDLHRVFRFWCAKVAAVCASVKRCMVGEQNAMANRGNFVAHGVGDGLHRIAAEFGDIVDRLGARLFEDVFQLALLVGGIDRDQGQAGKGAGEFEQHPFGQVVRIDGDASAFGMARGEGAGEALGVGQQLGVGPGAEDGAVIAEFLQRGLARRAGGGGAQHVADRDRRWIGPALRRENAIR